MRKAAFCLVASVIGIQLSIVASIIAGCFFVDHRSCTGERVDQLMQEIMTEVFALYASEKG